MADLQVPLSANEAPWAPPTYPYRPRDVSKEGPEMKYATVMCWCWCSCCCLCREWLRRRLPWLLVTGEGAHRDDYPLLSCAFRVLLSPLFTNIGSFLCSWRRPGAALFVFGGGGGVVNLLVFRCRRVTAYPGCEVSVTVFSSCRQWSSIEGRRGCL